MYELTNREEFTYVAVFSTGRIAIRLSMDARMLEAIPLAFLRPDGTWDINSNTAQVFLKMPAARLKFLFTQRAMMYLNQPPVTSFGLLDGLD